MKTLRIIISGIVQGIFFRAFIKEEAQNLGLKGYVRNLESGKVEAIIQGKEEEIKKMIDKCKEGSQSSKVTSIEIKEISNQEFKEFKIIKF